MGLGLGVWILAARLAAAPTGTSTATTGPNPLLPPDPTNAPPLSDEELALVEALTAEAPEPRWTGAGLPFGQHVPGPRLLEPLAPSVDTALNSLPLPLLGADETAAGRLQAVGPHFVERALDGWTQTDPWLWRGASLEDLSDQRGAAAGALRLRPEAAPEEDAARVRAGAAFRSADRGIRALAGAGWRQGPWGLRLDGAFAGQDDLRLPSTTVQTSTRALARWVGSLAGTASLGGRARDRGHLRVTGRADLRDEAPVPGTEARSGLARTLLGVDGRWGWGRGGSIEAAASHQRASHELDGQVWQADLHVRTPDLGPVFARVHGLWSDGEVGPLSIARREAGAELGFAAGPVRVEGGPLVLNQVAGALEATTAGWAGRARLDGPAGSFAFFETRRGRDLLWGLPSFSTGLRGFDGQVDVVSFGPGIEGERGWARLRAVGRWSDDGAFDEPDWVFRSEGALIIGSGFSVSGAMSVRPNLIAHLSVRYDADVGFIELHGRGRTDDFEGSGRSASGVTVGAMSGLELGAGFQLAVAVENVTDARVEDPVESALRPGTLEPGIDGRVLLAYRWP